jgi:hypothetical protein
MAAGLVLQGLWLTKGVVAGRYLDRRMSRKELTWVLRAKLYNVYNF